MTPRPDETPAQIAARYGCDPAKAPAEIQRIERGVSAFDPTNMPSWKDSRRKGSQIINRARRFEALKAREQRAQDEQVVATGRLVMVKAGEPKAPERKQRAAIDKAPGAVTGRDMEWLRLVESGKTRVAACIAVGLSPKAYSRIVARLTAAGHRIPAGFPATGDRGRHVVDLAWLAKVRAGMSHRDAEIAVGRKQSGAHHTALRLRRAGFDVPRTDQGPTNRDRLDAEWLQYVRNGMSHGAANVAVGRSPGAADVVAKRMRDAGHDVPTVGPEERARRGAKAANARWNK